MVIRAIQGDITKQTDVEAIVNAANESLLGGGGVDGAIHFAAGPELRKECRTLGGCKVGEAKITGAYNLPCKYIIHTVGPRWHGGKNNEAYFIRRCYISCLELAMYRGIRTIAFPSLSTGAFSYPVERACIEAVEAVYDFVNMYPDKFDLIEWVCFDKNTLEYYSRRIGFFEAGYYDEIDPMEKETELFSLLSEYAPEVHRSGEPGFDWLNEDGYSIVVKDGVEEHLFVDYNDGEFTLGLGSWHSHYSLYRAYYESLLNELKNILANKEAAVTIVCNGNWFGTMILPASKCTEKELIISVRCMMNREQLDKAKSFGYQIVCEFFDKSKDIKLTIDPEI